MKIAVCVTLILFCLQLSLQRSTPEDTSYVAAVLEYQVNSDVPTNILNYIKHIGEAAAQNADIVVFPEMTLNGQRQTPVPINGLLKQYPVPADHSELFDEILVNLSAAARDSQIYVVVNIQELMNCTGEPVDGHEYCPEQKEYLFNTNVVFDRTGAVIDRFRKINLFGEGSRTPALRPELGVFTTDFGVTFGHFICFDLMFQVPSVQVVESRNITDVIFPTMWFSEMPYLTAVQIQEAYAYTMNVNFLASGANNVRVGSAGSGIYSGKAGALVSTMPGTPTTRLLVARVPKVPGQVSGTYPGPIHDNPADHDSLFLISDPSLPSHVSRQLVSGSQEFTLVDKDVSCRFRVKLTQRAGDTPPHFRAFIQDGSNRYARRSVGVVMCGVTSCKTGDEMTCPYRHNQSDNHHVIEELEIEMSTYRRYVNSSLHCDDIVYYPSTLRINKFPLDPKNFTYAELQRESGRNHVMFKINAPQDDLINFGVWGRIFTRDEHSHRNVTAAEVEEYLKFEDSIFNGSDGTNFV